MCWFFIFPFFFLSCFSPVATCRFWEEFGLFLSIILSKFTFLPLEKKKKDVTEFIDLPSLLNIDMSLSSLFLPSSSTPVLAGRNVYNFFQVFLFLEKNGINFYFVLFIPFISIFAEIQPRPSSLFVGIFSY